MKNDQYELVDRYKEMPIAVFVEEVFDVKLFWYQKIYLNLICRRDALEKMYVPLTHYFRYRR